MRGQCVQSPVDNLRATGVLSYLGMVKATGEGTEPMPTLEVVGTRYREAIVACHQALSDSSARPRNLSRSSSAQRAAP